MTQEQNIKLTAAELSQLWAAYQNATLSDCVLKYFLNHVEDTEIRSVLERASAMTQSHVDQLIMFFTEEGNPVPYGFTEDDVNETAPRLFSDTYMLFYVQQMGKLGMNAHAMASSLSARKDIFAYFSKCLREYNNLQGLANDVLLSKGLYIRPPYIPKQDQVSFVSTDSTKKWFDKQRPLLSLEITNLYDNAERNALGIATMMGFSQVAKSKEVAQYFVQGKEIAAKHVETFGSVLRQDDLPLPMTWDSEVTESTVSPFSDKLMMFQTTSLNAIGMGYYGRSISTSMRTDVVTHYTRLTAEIGKYSMDGAKITIKNGWMEEPPMQADRKQIVKQQTRK